jgi:hypothetical protein
MRRRAQITAAAGQAAARQVESGVAAQPVEVVAIVWPQPIADMRARSTSAAVCLMCDVDRMAGD